MVAKELKFQMFRERRWQMSDNTYQYGNTVKINCIFHDFDGGKIDPDLVKIIIYNSRYKILEETIIHTENKTGVGEYFHYYVTENKNQLVYYEWYGEINGKPSIKRGKFTTVFI